MRPTAQLPDDPRLPGLVAIRDSGLARAIPALGLEEGGEAGGVELVLCGYHPGARATLEARVGPRRFAVKTFADDPAPEAALYQALGAAGLAGDSGARVPPLLAWDHDLRVLVIGWLEGDRKSTRLNSSHTVSSYAVFCLKKKNRTIPPAHARWT